MKESKKCEQFKLSSRNALPYLGGLETVLVCLSFHCMKESR